MPSGVFGLTEERRPRPAVRLPVHPRCPVLRTGQQQPHRATVSSFTLPTHSHRLPGVGSSCSLHPVRFHPVCLCISTYLLSPSSGLAVPRKTVTASPSQNPCCTPDPVPCSHHGPLCPPLPPHPLLKAQVALASGGGCSQGSLPHTGHVSIVHTETNTWPRVLV